MDISMDKRLVIILVAAAVTAAVCMYTGLLYPVYDGEELLQTDIHPYTFVFYGDNRPAKGSKQPETFNRIIEMINKDNPLFVIGGGDFVVEGTPENFEEFLTVVSHLEPPLFYVCGNHDDSVYYEQYLGERVYAFTYQHSLFVILDNSKKVLHEDQLAFLETLLKRKFEHTFVFLHMPPFDPEGSHCMIHPESFIDIVLKYKVDYVFCAHIHALYQEKRDDTVFVISGGGGAPPGKRRILPLYPGNSGR
jgi:3',5'-cyclic AMP phosphodiesterase CpdA